MAAWRSNWSTPAASPPNPLGERLTIGGISAGSVAAAWAYQFRVDVDQALVVAPSFGVTYVPAGLTSGVTQLARAMPNIFIWWDDK